jgi:CrcB protein
VTNVLLVALGGALGSVLRHLANMVVTVHILGQPFPPTLAINVAGSFAIGIVAALVADRSAAWFFFATGVMGGFTTYSAFSLETVRMMQSRSVAHALLYGVLTIVGCVLVCWIGLKAGALVTRRL